MNQFGPVLTNEDLFAKLGTNFDQLGNICNIFGQKIIYFYQSGHIWTNEDLFKHIPIGTNWDQMVPTGIPIGHI